MDQVHGVQTDTLFLGNDLNFDLTVDLSVGLA